MVGQFIRETNRDKEEVAKPLVAIKQPEPTLKRLLEVWLMNNEL